MEELDKVNSAGILALCACVAQRTLSLDYFFLIRP